MKTLILIAMLSLAACAITPNSTTDRVLTILGQALVAKSASGGYDYRQGLRDSQNYVNRNQIYYSPAFRCYTYGRVTTCNPQ